MISIRIKKLTIRGLNDYFLSDLIKKRFSVLSCLIFSQNQ